MKKNYFISYNNQDEEWAKWIDWQLRAEGYDTIIQVYDFPVGTNFVSEMHDALKKADHILCILTQQFLNSDWCKEEWTNALDRLILVRVADVKPDGILKCRSYIDLLGASEDEAKELLLSKIKKELRPVEKPEFPTTREKKPAFPRGYLPPNNLPDRNDNFTGRKEKLEEIRAAFEKSGPGGTVCVKQSIAGLGGVGKTQIALEYAHRFLKDYKDAIWWVNTERSPRKDLMKFVLEFAEELKPDLKDWEAVSQVKDEDLERLLNKWFTNHNSFLLIFDNVEDFNLLKGCLPSTTGHVLITTRDQRCPICPKRKTVEVNEFAPHEAAEFLKKRLSGKGVDAAELAKQLGNEGVDAAELAKRLGYFPLALEQAAAYLLCTDKSCREYLGLLEKYGLKVFDQLGAVPYGYKETGDKEKETINTTWQISYNKIESESSRQLFNLLAYFAPDDIPLTMLIKGRNHLPEPLQTDLANELRLDNVILELTQYSLVRKKDGLLSLHRLLQEVVMEKLKNDKDTRWHAYCLKVLPDPGLRIGGITELDQIDINDHRNAILRNAKKIYEDYGTQVIITGTSWGNPENQEYLDTVTIGPSFGMPDECPNDQEYLDKVNAELFFKMAVEHCNQSDYDQALKWFQKALAIQEKVLGVEHIDTILTYGNIAIVYNDLRDYDKALNWNNIALARKSDPRHRVCRLRRNRNVS